MNGALEALAAAFLPPLTPFTELLEASEKLQGMRGEGTKRAPALLPSPDKA